MQLTPYDQVRELQRMESEFDMFLSHDDWHQSVSGHEASSMNLYTEDDQLVAEFSLPQFKKSEVKATIGQNMLEVVAAHHETSEDTHKHYLHHETSSQYFRRVSLPSGADTANMRASFKDGILRVTMPFNEDSDGTEIAIE
jgi:HSP20 family protein